MSVSVRIKQKSLFKKKLNINEIIEWTGLSYGVCDESYRLREGEMAEHTLLYNKNRLARGIDVSLDGTDVVLLLSLPTSPAEIREFYGVIDRICNRLKVKTYIREEEQVSLNDKDKFIEYDERGSIAGLEDIREKIGSDEYKRLEIFGVLNPISLGLAEVGEIGDNLDSIENHLHRIQSLDVYYAAPRVYRIGEKLVGIYAIGADIPSVVPDKPYIVLNRIQGIEEWYVMVKDGKTVRYEDFINNAGEKQYYDANHVVVTLSDGDISKMIERFSAEI